MKPVRGYGADLVAESPKLDPAAKQHHVSQHPLSVGPASGYAVQRLMFDATGPDSAGLPRWAAVGRAIILPTAGVSAALFVTQSLKNPVFPTPLFFASIVISTWFGGLASGLLAVILAITGLNYYFIPPIYSFALDKPQTLYLLEFALPALLSCGFIRRRRRTENSLRETRLELESRVMTRTAELSTANEQLTGQIAERIRAEEIVRKTQSELARIMRVLTVGELGVSIAHEINQPLMAVMVNGDACLRWLENEPPRLDEARSSVTRMIAEISRAAQIVTRIRDISRNTGPARTPVDLNQVTQETLTLVAPELTRGMIVLDLALTPNLRPVQADGVQMQQVILNLVVNAVEAMSGEDREQRTLSIRTHMGDDHSVTLSVEDTGLGLPDGDPEQLFSAFFTTKKDGVGMGLAISRTIIESHGGRIWAVSGKRGAVFQFRLPPGRAI